MRPIDVIRKAKDIYMSGRVSGMCESFEWAIGSDWNPIGSDWNLYLKNNIPLFCYDVAVQKFGATGHPTNFWWSKTNYWWSKMDRDVRIKYFDWLIERYRDPACGDYYPDI